MGRGRRSKRIHEYTIEAPIGMGLSGQVFRAQKADGILVALKVLDPKRERDATVRGYFANEQLILREVTAHRQHPHIVAYVGSHFATTPYVLATRYVAGARRLDSLLGRPLSISIILRVVRQIASALDYLHYGHPVFAPVRHRDVTPRNILLNSDGDAILIDLSIARHPFFALVDERGLGSPQYMPLEQYSFEDAPATDQAALALVALHMLVGAPLLPTSARVARRRLEELYYTQFAALHKLLRGHERLTDVFCTALARDPNERFATCEEFSDQLRQALRQPQR